MPISSKKKTTPVDNQVLVKLGVLERLVDTLLDRMAQAEASIKGGDANMREILSIVAKLQVTEEEDWPMPTGQPSSNPDENKSASEKDDLDSILDT